MLPGIMRGCNPAFRLLLVLTVRLSLLKCDRRNRPAKSQHPSEPTVQLLNQIRVSVQRNMLQRLSQTILGSDFHHSRAGSSNISAFISDIWCETGCIRCTDRLLNRCVALLPRRSNKSITQRAKAVSNTEIPVGLPPYNAYRMSIDSEGSSGGYKRGEPTRSDFFKSGLQQLITPCSIIQCHTMSSCDPILKLWRNMLTKPDYLAAKGTNRRVEGLDASFNTGLSLYPRVDTSHHL